MFSGLNSKAENPPFRIPRFRALSLRIFGEFFSKHFVSHTIETTLRKAKMGMNRIEFYSQNAMMELIAIIIILSLGTILTLIFVHLIFLISAGSFLASVSVLAIILETPATIARLRKRKIDSMLTLALGFFATMASADIPIDIIMRELGNAIQYGEISREARSIWLRSTLFGQDIVTSIRTAVKNSPSQRFSEFLQGIITSVNSGGDLKLYFIAKADQYQNELSTLIKQNSNSLGILSESFVTVGVAFPLILLIIVGVVAYLSPGSPAGLVDLLFFTVAVIIPIILILFAYFFRSTMGEIEL